MKPIFMGVNYLAGGGGGGGGYNFSQQLFGYTEYENINLDVIFNTSNGYELGRAWVPAYFIGGVVIFSLLETEQALL